MNAEEKITKLKDFFLNLGKEDNKGVINLAQIAKVEKWWIEVENDTFAVGNKIIRKWWDNETEPLEAGEYELEEGNKMMVDSSGIITLINSDVKFNSNKKTKLEEVNPMEEEMKNLKAENEAFKTELEELKAQLVTATEEKAVELAKEEEKEEVKEDVVEEKDNVLLTKIEEMEAKILELSKQPVREVEIKEENLSFAELQMRSDELARKN